MHSLSHIVEQKSTVNFQSAKLFLINTINEEGMKMIDPITAISAATAAFNGVRKLVAAGREIEDVVGQLGKWYGAAADLQRAEQQRKNPPLFSKLFMSGSIEEEALAILVQKKKLEEQRYELQQFIKFTHGTAAWDELLRMEGQIRKRRQQEIYDKKIFREKVIGIVALTVVLAVGLGLLGLFVYSLMGLDRGWFD